MPSEVELAFWPIVVGIVTNVSCALLGCYLLLRRMSLLGDAISHAILPGLAIGFLLSGSINVVPMFIGALVCGLLTAVLAQTLHRYARGPEDSSMGVVFTSLFALGVILVSSMDQAHIDADCVLYGLLELVGFDTFSLWGLQGLRVLAGLLPTLLVTLVFVTLLWKELKLSAFDPMLATAMGFHATLIHYLLMGMVSIVTVASFQAVGAILVIAMLIVPAATAHLLTDRLGWMMCWAVVVGVMSAVFGYIGAYLWNTNGAGMMAVVAGLQFTLALFLAPRYGIVSKGVRNLRLALRIVREDIIAMLYRLEEKQPAVPMTAPWRNCVRFAGGGPIAWLAIPLLRYRGQIAFQSGGRLALTAAGREQAQSLVRSHRLWEAFLDQNFELPADHLHEPASRIEHYIGPELQDRLAHELEGPQRDPHGRIIPPSPAPPRPDEGDGA